MANEKQVVYVVRDTETGELVSDITSSRRVYYKHFANAENVIGIYRERKSKPKHGKLEIVEFALQEVASYAVD